MPPELGGVSSWSSCGSASAISGAGSRPSRNEDVERPFKSGQPFSCCIGRRRRNHTSSVRHKPHLTECLENNELGTFPSFPLSPHDLAVSCLSRNRRFLSFLRIEGKWQLVWMSCEIPAGRWLGVSYVYVYTTKNKRSQGVPWTPLWPLFGHNQRIGSRTEGEETRAKAFSNPVLSCCIS